MKCPLLGLDEQNRPWAQKANQTECLKEECAWWDKQNECCVINSIASHLGSIWLNLSFIFDKMPHEGQFRK